MATNKDIDDFCIRMHIKDDCTVDGEKIGIRLLIELLDKFAQEQVKKCSLHNVSNNEVVVVDFSRRLVKEGLITDYEKMVNFRNGYLLKSTTDC